MCSRTRATRPLSYECHPRQDNGGAEHGLPVCGGARAPRPAHPRQAVDVGAIPDGRLDDGRRDAAVDGVAADDDASGAGVGSDSRLADVADLAEMPAVEFDDVDGVVQE